VIIIAKFVRLHKGFMRKYEKIYGEVREEKYGWIKIGVQGSKSFIRTIILVFREVVVES